MLNWVKATVNPGLSNFHTYFERGLVRLLTLGYEALL